MILIKFMLIYLNLCSTKGLFFSVDILVFDILNFVFFKVQYIHYCWKHYVERLRRNFYIFFVEVSKWKENKEIGTISFQVRIPMKKPKIFLDSFYVSLQKQLLKFGFNNLSLEETKNIYTVKKSLKYRAIGCF